MHARATSPDAVDPFNQMATRQAKTFPLDDPPAVDGDAGFVGLNTRNAPEALEPGWVTAAENVEFMNGAARTRRGLHTPLWARAGGTFHGVASVRDPRTFIEGALIAGTDAIWFVRPGTPPREMAAPAAITGPVSFVEAFGKVYAFRDGQAPWEWAGGDWTEVERVDLADGTRPVEFAATAELIGDRLLVPHGEFVDISDIGEPLYYGLTNRIRCTQGRGPVVRVFPFTRTSALVFNRGGIVLLSGVAGNLSALSVEILNPELGLVAARSVAAVGGDALFLAAGGVYRVRQVVQERLETAPVAVSQPIEGLLRSRINWSAAGAASAAVWGERYYLAVPLDRSAANNAVLVYNVATNAWEGLHTFPEGVRMDALTLATVRGEQRLMATDFAAGRQYLMYEDREDCLPDGAVPVEASLTTRAYLAGHAGRKRWNTVEVVTAGWGPEWRLELLMDGVTENEALYPDPVTRSRTAGMLAGAADWDATNAGDDHGAAGREDYHVVLDPPMVLGNGIVLNREQDLTDRFLAGETGRAARLRLTSSAGVTALRAAQIEGTNIDRAYVPTT